MTDKSICFVPHLEGLGGPASFQRRLAAGLEKNGYPVHYDPNDPGCQVILVFGGSSWLNLLWKARRRGVRIVQRLNGMNWIHRRRPSSPRFYLRSEWNNWNISTIRRYLADRIIYQSNFVRSWWQTVFGQVDAQSTVIYNGVDLNEFSPQGSHSRPVDRDRILLVEGRFKSGYEVGLSNGVRLVEELQKNHHRPVELMVVGQVSDDLKALYSQRNVTIHWTDVVAPGAVPELDRSAHALFSADLNAACPNSVVEAMSCGLPVIGFATGALAELVQNNSGLVVPYGSNFWRLEQPDISALVDAAREVLGKQEMYRTGARARAEEIFSIDNVIKRYLDVLLSDLN